jgi:DNA polymerase-4
MDSRLNGRPILIGGTGDRGVVSAASYETRNFGVRSGMPMRMAQQLCPEAVTIRGNAANYTKFSKVVTDIIQDSVPVLEKASIDEFYADLSGMDRFFGCYRYASELRQKVIRESGLPISFGLSQNKTVSKIATGEAKPNNQLLVNYGEEKVFLSPLSIRKIPTVGEKMFHLLCNMGVKKIETLQLMPVELLQSTLGKFGVQIWNKANGLDDSPVIQYHERKSISSERTYGRDTTDMQQLTTTIKAMAENLAYQLRQGNRLCSCVTVKLRYADFNTYTKQVQIPYTSADHHLIPKVMELFNKLYDRRLLVRLIGVRYSGLIHGNYQMNLFDDVARMIRLYEAMDEIRAKFGSRSIMRASTFSARTIGSFYNPFSGEPPIVLAHRTQ